MTHLTRFWDQWRADRELAMIAAGFPTELAPNLSRQEAEGRQRIMWTYGPVEALSALSGVIRRKDSDSISLVLMSRSTAEELGVAVPERLAA